MDGPAPCRTVGAYGQNQEIDMSRPSPRTARCFFAGGVLALTVAAAGCGGSRYPVAGRVLLDGEPLAGKEGGVVLKPDGTKRNETRVSPIGVLQRDGTFSVLTKGRPGAPIG